MKPTSFFCRPLLWAAALLLALSCVAHAHGDVTPQAVDTGNLPKLGEEWRVDNPYSKNPEAIRIGASGFNQNCARCHGLEAISGGIAPDLRHLDDDCAGLRVWGSPWQPEFGGWAFNLGRGAPLAAKWALIEALR